MDSNKIRLFTDGKTYKTLTHGTENYKAKQIILIARGLTTEVVGEQRERILKDLFKALSIS